MAYAFALKLQNKEMLKNIAQPKIQKEVSKIFYNEKQKYLVHDDYYVIGDDKRMYYLNGILLNNQVMHSKRIIETRSLLFPKKPKVIWEIKIVK